MTETSEIQLPEDRPLEIAGRVYQSRLLVGTGKYRDMMETGHAIESSGAEIVTVAVRRTNLGQNPDQGTRRSCFKAVNDLVGFNIDNLFTRSHGVTDRFVPGNDGAVGHLDAPLGDRDRVERTTHS